MRRVLGLRARPADRDDERVIASALGVLAPSAALILVGVLMLGFAFRGTR